MLFEGAQKSKDNRFAFFTQSDVQKMIYSKVNQTNETLCLEEDMVMAILRNFQWNKERTEQEYLLSNDPSKIACKTGIQFD